MPKRKQSLNTVYISARLKEKLRPISKHTLTAVIAPMGYGKTTAVNWYLGEAAKSGRIKIIRISVYSDNLAIFWKSTQDAFAHAGFTFLSEYVCPCDEAGGSMLADELCRRFSAEEPCYIFIDDFHLLTDRRISSFLCRLADRAPENLHLIVVSRNKFLSRAEVLRLGRRLYELGTEHLRLTRAEVKAYADRCGAELSEKELDKLLYSSEGWFSAVYLNLQAHSEPCALLSGSDIYEMFTAAMINPLPKNQRDFLAVMGLADEFTDDTARYVTEDENAESILTALTEKNAFIKRLSDGKTYRFHNMMRECAERTFSSLEKERQKEYLYRFGKWFENCGQYIYAMKFYRKCENYGALLRVVRLDAGILLSSLEPDAVLSAVRECPEAVLKQHPAAILVLMRSMFNWRKTPEMQRMRALLLAAIDEQTEMPETERGNLLGECDLIMSFLMYNDISAMSRLHRRADSRMSRPAVSIRKSGGWTFGSPSVLMMFHRAAGELNKELTEMDECMPHYYKITEGHGMGAEKIMRAEACFMQGRFTDAQIYLESAYAAVRESDQENMALCCDFLAWRLYLNTDISLKYTLAERYAAVLNYHNSAWVNIFNSVCAYYYALLGKNEKIPSIFKEHNLSKVNILAPGKPMAGMIENQVYLSQGAYIEVIAHTESLLSACEAMHYSLVALHLQIQAAAAYEMLGRRENARGMLKSALFGAAPDNLVIPFAENYRYIKALIAECEACNPELTRQIMRLGENLSARESLLCGQKCRPAALSSLTEREYTLVVLIAERLSNREIAEKLFLTEGSVKQYINQLYSKLAIDGDTRTKRKRLAELTKG